MIIELGPSEARAVLALVKSAAKMEPSDAMYWTLIGQQIEQCLSAQAPGKFYQCTACTDRTVDDGSPKA